MYKITDASQRDVLLKHLHTNGVGAGIHYPIPISELGAYKELQHYSEVLTNATSLAPAIISLPMYPEMTHEQQDKVVGLISKFFDNL